MTILLTILIIPCLVLWIANCLDKYIHAEEIIKHEQWEEEKMVWPN